MRKNNVERPVYYNVRRVNAQWIARVSGDVRLAMREEAVRRVRKRVMRAAGSPSSAMALRRMRDLMELGSLPKAEKER